MVYEAAISGMTCSHCAAAVTAAAESLDGVTSASVHLSAGTLRIASASELDEGALSAAVDTAGYQLTSLHEVV
jgi:copper chaperone CopZ